MKITLLTVVLFTSSILFAQKNTDTQNIKSTDSIYFRDGSFELIGKNAPKENEKLIFNVWSCDNKEGKCFYKDKLVDRLVLDIDYGKKSKGNKSLDIKQTILTPLNFSEVFVKPIRKAKIVGLPKLAYKGENYDYYEGNLIAGGNKDFAILTKPNSRDVVAIITTRYFIGGHVFNYKYLLENSKKMFSNPIPIKAALKEKNYKNKNYNPYKVMDKCGKLIEGKIHFLF